MKRLVVSMTRLKLMSYFFKLEILFIIFRLRNFHSWMQDKNSWLNLKTL
jgi:hypothetical protein